MDIVGGRTEGRKGGGTEGHKRWESVSQCSGSAEGYVVEMGEVVPHFSFFGKVQAGRHSRVDNTVDVGCETHSAVP